MRGLTMKRQICILLLLLAVLLLRSADTFSVKLTTTAPRGQTVFSAVWLLGVLPAALLAGLHFCGVTPYYLLSLILLGLGRLPFVIRCERRRPSARAIAASPEMRMTAMPAGEQRGANLKKLLEIAGTAENGMNTGLYFFLKLL